MCTCLAVCMRVSSCNHIISCLIRRLINRPLIFRSRLKPLSSSAKIADIGPDENSGMFQCSIWAEKCNHWSSSWNVLTIPDSGMEMGDRAFAGCSSLTSLAILDSVVCCYWMEGLQWLQFIDKPDNFWLCEIRDTAFAGYSLLTGQNSGIYGNYLDTRHLPAAAHWRAWQFPTLWLKLKTVHLLAAVDNSRLCECNWTQGFHWLQITSSLTSLTIPNSVTVIGHRTFAYCSLLTSLTIPDSLNHGVWHGEAFLWFRTGRLLAAAH